MSELTKEKVTELFPNALTRRYVKGQIICYQGDKPQHIFYLAKGHVRLYDVDEEGNEKVLHFMGPYNIFPMHYAFKVTDEVQAFYCAVDDCELIAIPLKDFTEATENDIEFANSLIRWFLTEINQLVYRISSLEKTDSRLKVLYALKYLADDYGQATGEWQRLNFPITHQFLADFTGLARETVSLTMHELKKDKVIRSSKVHELDINREELSKLD